MLREEIEVAKRLIKTDTVQITIGEIATMYADRELDVLPDFQRLFRWSIEKKTAFVESILIGIPVPPAFAYENKDGTWELIDGLQRISTVLEFMGVLRDPDDENKLLVSRLCGTEYLPALKGASWNDEDEASLNKALKLLFRRSRLDFQVLKHPSDPRTKFDLFQRLNRGGAYANEQEVRSCSMVLANADFTATIKRFSCSDQFKSIFRISDNQVLNQENVELAVRLIVHTFRNFTNDSDVQEFLDRSIIDVLIHEDKNKVICRVVWAVSLLHELFGAQALVPTNDAVSGVSSRFSMRALEAIAVGVARNEDAIKRVKDPGGFVRERVESFWQNPSVVPMAASGLRGTTRLQRTVPFGAKWFNPNAG